MTEVRVVNEACEVAVFTVGSEGDLEPVTEGVVCPYGHWIAAAEHLVKMGFHPPGVHSSVETPNGRHWPWFKIDDTEEPDTINPQ